MDTVGAVFKVFAPLYVVQVFVCVASSVLVCVLGVGLGKAMRWWLPFAILSKVWFAKSFCLRLFDKLYPPARWDCAFHAYCYFTERLSVSGESSI